jgi:hypothetical protein
MLKSLIGAFIGSKIDKRRDGRGGIAGAALGAAAVRVATRSIPGALAIGGAAVAASLIGKRIKARRAANEQLPPVPPRPPGPQA